MTTSDDPDLFAPAEGAQHDISDAERDALFADLDLADSEPGHSAGELAPEPASGPSRYVQSASGWHVRAEDLGPEGMDPIPRDELRVSFAGLDAEAAARHFAALVPWAEAQFDSARVQIPECWHLHTHALEHLLDLLVWDNATTLHQPNFYDGSPEVREDSRGWLRSQYLARRDQVMLELERQLAACQPEPARKDVRFQGPPRTDGPATGEWWRESYPHHAPHVRRRPLLVVGEGELPGAFRDTSAPL